MSKAGRLDRYRVPPGNPEGEFADLEQSVLANKRGITDLQTLQIAEEQALARAYEQLLSEVRVDTPMYCELIRHIHVTIFGTLFEWAGRWRTVQISKPGAIWPPPHYLDQAMQEFERSVLVPRLATSPMSDDLFVSAAAEIQGEFLAIHPFREGNARTIKLFTDLIAVRTGRPILRYESSDAGTQQYFEAAQSALLAKDYKLMAEVIRQALRRTQETT